MSDLISRSALIKKLNSAQGTCKANKVIADYIGKKVSEICEETIGVCKDMVEQAPAVDAVEVVRCKDCRHSKNNGYLCIRKTKNAGYNAADKVFPGFFCAAGKVRDGNETD